MATDEGPRTLFLVIRFALYFVLFLISASSIGILLRTSGIGGFGESGPVEWCQTGFLMATAAIFCWLARTDRAFVGLHVALGMLAAIAAIRELDALLDDLLPFPYGGWQLVACVPLLLGTVGVIRCWRSLRDGFEWLTTQTIFGLMWAGAVIALPVAQLLGHRPFLRLILAEQHTSDVRRFIEESLEWVGFLMILLGAIETAICRRRTV